MANARTEATGVAPMWWVAHEGLMTHLCGPDVSHLYLKYPLTGEFTVTADTWIGGWAESNFGYGGLAYNGYHFGSDIQITSIGNRRDSVHKPDPIEIGDRYNQTSLEIQSDKVRYRANGHLIHEESRSSDVSPWLFIECHRAWYTAVRDVRFTGQPVIPRQVALTDNDSLLGWVSEFYNETRPNRETNRPSTRTSSDRNQQERNSRVRLAGQRRSHSRSVLSRHSGLGKSSVQQSRLHYDRPLLSGEKIRYEFWYESGPGGCHVSPALDRLAFQFDTDGVKLHWMTDGSTPEDGYGGLAADNVLNDKSTQRGKVGLKDNDWNAVEVSLKDGVVTLSLNGTVVGVRKLEPENSCQFGFYHDKNATSVQVRNVVLSGDWPKTLAPEITSNLLATVREQSSSERRAYGSTVDEKFHTDGLDQLLLRTRAMSADEQYETLKNWVLPNNDHASFRLYGAFTATNGIPSSNQLTSARIDSDDARSKSQVRRQLPGGELYAPALDLVDVAKKQKRLDELAKLVEQSPADNPVAIRSKLALQVLIKIAGGDFAKATDGLDQLQTLCRSIPEDTPLMNRWPEMVVGADAIRHPELRTAALPLLIVMVEHQHKKGLGDAWEIPVCGMRDLCKALLDADQVRVAGGPSPRGQWIPSLIEFADHNSYGPVSHWNYRDQEVSHMAGGGHDYLYFQSPLRGTFSVEAEVATYGWRETRMFYHGHWVGPQYTKVVVELGNLTTNWQSSKIEPALEFGDWCQMKLAVEPNKATYFINGRQVHEQTLPDQADPWFGLMTWGSFSGGARSIRITGQPEIPEQLNLTSRNDLIGWTATLYHDPMGNDENAAWVKSDSEIVGKRFEPATGRKRQSLLRYHRPLQEDSVVNYDFFHAPGQTHVHPALGRMAFLLDPDGVKLHWLTDEQFDRTGLSPDNAVEEKANRRGPQTVPLKQDAWNHVQMTLVGNTVKLTLNDAEIYESPVALTNQRQFGLFHYADESDVRVKDVVYKGDWPKTLPKLKEQELSGLGPQKYDFADGELANKYTWDFQQPAPRFLKP